MGANFLFLNPFLTAAIGSGLEYTSETGFKNSLFGKKTTVRWGLETFVGGSLNVAAGKGANAMTPHLGEATANAASFFLGNSYGNILIGINDEKKTKDDAKETH
ncbi:hypothetical protein [Chitinophaga sancti]|uniref:Uncharacterized protein n=1 Tax=Chitinophaga sancti TaxID=1004 RepID=A0A1K1T2B1_9BACT|nr:hypothetical protein [Chitinophaga sancti]WQD63837.1 hypothetical protein U0033_05475 [Chitinophaga sancti]WQG90538.1 hypothetical protein SR876_03445 [Chitinophaga sancti]SFW90479.1 hypothetical protein SAMN05661012_06623 [Chitinophaga sancti]